MGLELLFLVAASWVLVAPDKYTLKVRSGVAGALRGMAGSRRAGGSGSAAKAGSSSRRRAGRGKRSGGTNLFVAARDGWREGVRAAEKRRAEGRDTWSRTVRAGRRIGQGAGRIVGGTRSVIAGARAWRQERADRRATVADFEAAEDEHLADVITIEPAPAATGRRARAADRARYAAGGDAAAPGGDTGVVFLADRANGGRPPTSLDGRTYGGTDCPCAACSNGWPGLCSWQRDAEYLRFVEEREAAGRPVPEDHGVLRTGPPGADPEFMIIDPAGPQPSVLITPEGVIVDQPQTTNADEEPETDSCRHYPVSVDGRRVCGICGTSDLDQVPSGRMAGDLNHTKENDMSVNITELESLDSLQAEIDQAKAAAAAHLESGAGLREWAHSLTERASANGWGTDGLDAAFAAIAENAPQDIGEGFVSGLAAAENAIGEARSLGELAAAQGARGSVDAFRSA